MKYGTDHPNIYVYVYINIKFLISLPTTLINNEFYHKKQQQGNLYTTQFTHSLYGKKCTIKKNTCLQINLT